MARKHRVKGGIYGKKGARISSITEMVLIIIAVVFGLTFILADMNIEYSTNNSMPFSSQTTEYIGNLTQFSKTSRTELAGGASTEIAGIGILPSTYWGILKASFLMLFDILSGNWIPMSLSYAFFGNPVAIMTGILLQAAFIIGMAYAILRFFSKVIP